MKLSEEQKIFIESPIEYSVLIATAGSGKTFSVANKAIRLTTKKIVKPTEIVLISFSNAALSAFDKYGKYISAKGLSAKTKIRKTTLHQLYYALVNDRLYNDPVDVQNLSGRPFRMFDPNEPCTEDCDFKIIDACVENIHKLGAKYLIIDEAQDITDDQHNFICFLSNYMFVTLVGDPNQNIYSTFTGSKKTSSNYLMQWSHSVYQLTINFRCSPEIIEFSNTYLTYKQPISSYLGDTFNKPKVIKTGKAGTTVVNVILKVLKRIHADDKITGIIFPTRTNKSSFISMMHIYDKIEKVYPVKLLVNILSDKEKRVDNKYNKAMKQSLSNGEVYMSTIHGVKGLEFDSTIILGMRDSLMGRTITKDIEREHKFLRYVAYTRARINTYIVYGNENDSDILINKKHVETLSSSDFKETTIEMSNEKEYKEYETDYTCVEVADTMSRKPVHELIITELVPKLGIEIKNADDAVLVGMYLEQKVKEILKFPVPKYTLWCNNYEKGVSKKNYYVFENGSLKSTLSSLVANRIPIQCKFNIYRDEREVAKLMGKLVNGDILERTIALVCFDLCSIKAYEMLYTNLTVYKNNLNDFSEHLVNVTAPYLFCVKSDEYEELPPIEFSEIAQGKGGEMIFDKDIKISYLTDFMITDDCMSVPLEFKYSTDDSLGIKQVSLYAMFMNQPHGYFFNSLTGSLIRVQAYDNKYINGLISFQKHISRFVYEFPNIPNSGNISDIFIRDRIMCLDTETSGIMKLDKKHNPVSYADKSYDNCRMLELSYVITDPSLDNIHLKRQMYIKNDEVINSEIALSINHISDEFRKNNGIPFGEAYNTFMNDLRSCSFIVCHGAAFDLSVIASECNRLGLPILFLTNYKHICTKIGTIKKPGGLSEIVDCREFSAHNALIDSIMCLQLLRLKFEKPVDKTLFVI